MPIKAPILSYNRPIVVKVVVFRVSMVGVCHKVASRGIVADTTLECQGDEDRI